MDSQLHGCPLQTGSAECRKGTSTSSLEEGAVRETLQVLELELKGHLGFGWTQSRAHSSGRNGPRKKQSQESTGVFRRPFGGTVAAVSQLSTALELKPHCVGVGAEEGVLGSG